jgi:GNAT superfamily N-acetyltransferase
MIRAARPADVPVLLALVRELAAYEREPDAVETTEPMLHAALFGDAPVASCHVAELDGRVVGFALWYVTFSTWKGRPGLWLEDLFVRPAARGHGLGRALLQELAEVCVQRGYARFEWWVLDWNVDAQGFYRSLGARPEDEWTVWRVDGDRLAALAAGGRPSAHRAGDEPGVAPGA